MLENPRSVQHEFGVAARLCRGIPRAGEPVTAIDILLEPDATMVQRAQADNARLLKAYPDGFALDGITTRLAPRRTLAWTKREQSRRSTYLARLGSCLGYAFEQRCG